MSLTKSDYTKLHKNHRRGKRVNIALNTELVQQAYIYICIYIQFKPNLHVNKMQFIDITRPSSFHEKKKKSTNRQWWLPVKRYTILLLEECALVDRNNAPNNLLNVTFDIHYSVHRHCFNTEHLSSPPVFSGFVFLDL